MASQVRRAVTCERCGKHAEQCFGENGPKWYESFHCSSCGKAFEADGAGPIPDEFRNVILAMEGEWVLEATEHPSVRLRKGLRQTLALSLNDLRLLVAGLPGEVRRGTKNEMEQLSRRLQEDADATTLSLRPLHETGSKSSSGGWLP